MEDADKELLAALRYIINTSELPFERRTDNLDISHSPGYADRNNPLREYFPMRRLLTDDLPPAHDLRTKFRRIHRRIFRQYKQRFYGDVLALQRSRLEAGTVSLPRVYAERGKLAVLLLRMETCLVLHWMDFRQPELSVRWCFEEIEKLLAISRVTVINEIS